MAKAKRAKTVIICKTETGRQLQARGYDVLAQKVERGTLSAEQAQAQADRIDRETGRDMAGTYAGTYGAKCGLISLHQIENFSGGQEYIRQLAEQAEYVNARMSDRVTKDGAVIPGVRYDKLFDTTETMSDCMDTLQESALAICEQGFMAGKSTSSAYGQTGAQNPVHTNEYGHVRTDTYSYTHRQAIDSANRFVNAQAKREHKRMNTHSDRDIVTDDKSKLMYSVGMAEQTYTMDIESTALKMVLSVCRTQWERDVIVAYASAPAHIAQRNGDSTMPTKTDILAHMRRHAGQYTESTQRMLSMTDKTVIGHIGKALKSLAESENSNIIRMYLLESLYEHRDSKAIRIHA